MIRRISLLLFASLLWCQPLKQPVEIIDLVRDNLRKLEDYQVDLKIKIAVPGFRMPGKSVHYAFKAPDKVKLETFGFAMVPRQGILPFYSELMGDSLHIKAETLEKTEVEGESVWIIAFQDTFYNEDALIKLWIGDPSGTILKGVATIGGLDVFTLTSQYEKIDQVAYMPVVTKIDLKLPPEMKTLRHLNSTPQAKMDIMESMKSDTSSTPIQGAIELIFSKYKLNRGIPDSYFDEEKSN